MKPRASEMPDGKLWYEASDRGGAIYSGKSVGCERFLWFDIAPIGLCGPPSQMHGVITMSDENEPNQARQAGVAGGADLSLALPRMLSQCLTVTSSSSSVNECSERGKKSAALFVPRATFPLRLARPRPPRRDRAETHIATYRWPSPAPSPHTSREASTQLSRSRSRLASPALA